MADNTTNRNDGEVDVTSAKIGGTSNTIGKGTLLMIAAAIIFLIVAAVLFSGFLSAPTGGSAANSANAGSHVGP